MIQNSKKMLLMYWHDFEQKGMGTNIRLYTIAKLLKEEGYSVDLYALSDLWSDFTDFNKRKCFINKLYLYSYRDIDKTFNINRLNNFVTPRMKEQFREILRDNDYDAIGVVYLEQSDLLKYMISDKCKKIYFFEDDLALAESYNGKHIGGLIEDQIRKLSYFDEIVYVSNDEKLFYDKFLKNIDTSLVHALLPISELDTNSAKENDIIFVGHDNIYNIEGLFWFFDNVYPLLNKDISIKIIGKVCSHLKRQYPNVCIAGFVDDLDKEYRNSKITICPLRQGTGIKVKIMEAMSYGLPSVVTSRGADGFTDKTQFGSFVTDNPSEFAEYIHQLLQDKKLYSEMSKKSHEYFIEYLSYDSNKRKMLDVFKYELTDKLIRDRIIPYNKVAKLTINGHLFNAGGAIEQVVSVYVNGRAISDWDSNTGTFSADIPMEIFEISALAKIEFLISCPARPVDYNIGGDLRYLGVYLKTVRLDMPDESSIVLDFADWDMHCCIDGFYNAESDGRWTDGEKASIKFLLPNPKVSVVIVSNSDADMLDRAIKSVYNTKYDNLECIVIDKTGSDEVEKLAILLDDKIDYFTSNPYSYPHALNLGLEKCSGDFILFLDSAASISDDFFTNALKTIAKSGATYSVSSGYCAGRYCVEIPCTDFGEVSIFAMPPCSLSGMLISRDIFDKIRNFDEKLQYAYLTDFQLKVLVNCQFQGVKSGNVAQYFTEEPQIHNTSIPYIEELAGVITRYHPEQTKSSINSLLKYVISGTINERIALDIGTFYRNDFYSYDQKQYLKQLVAKDGIVLTDDSASLLVECERLHSQMDEIRNNKWYRFGQLPRKEKIKKIINVLFKRFLNKFPIFKKNIKISQNVSAFKTRQSEDKINVLYDATFLSNGAITGANRTGIFFVAYNILKEFYKHPKLNVFLYCESAQMEMTRRFLKSEYINKGNISFINENNDKFITDLTNIDAYMSPMHKPIDVVERLDYIKKFTIVYDLIPYIFPDFFPDMNNDDYWVKKLVQYMNPNDYFFAISSATKNDMLRFAKATPENIFVTYLGASDNFYCCTNKDKINTIRGKYNIPLNKRYIFSLCTIEPRKNLIFAVKGFIQFIKKHQIDDLIFVMGGTQWDFFVDKLEKEISDCADYMKYIMRLGYVDDADLSPLYSGAELVVYPSLYEGFGLPILEAMTCGTPVVTSNNSSCPEVIGDAGITIDPNSIEELVAAIEKIYFNHNIRQQFIDKGLARSKTFSWASTVDNMANIMSNIVFSDNKRS